MATTDDIGATARRTLHGQEKPVGLVLRGHFLTEEVEWQDQIGGSAPPLERWTAPPHRATAIKAVVKGFRNHDRGRLIMACGTSKTLTALWIAERLESSLTLVLVPSLSLVQQNLAEWGRHAAKDFDTLVVCSDESVVQSKADTAIQSTADNLHTAVRDFPGLSSEGPLMQFEIRCCDFRIRSNRMHCCVLLPLILAIVVSRTSAVAQDASARLLWALDLGSASYGGASIGDLAGDGHMVLVFGTYFTARFHRAISCRSGMLTARSEQMPRANMHTMMHIDSRFRAIHRNLATSVLSNHQLRVVFISHWALAHG